MNDFIRYVLWELKNSLLLVFLLGIAAVGILALCRRIHNKRCGGERNFPGEERSCGCCLPGTW